MELIRTHGALVAACVLAAGCAASPQTPDEVAERPAGPTTAAVGAVGEIPPGAPRGDRPPDTTASPTTIVDDDDDDDSTRVARRVLRRIPVEREERGGYDRFQFRPGADLDDDGCDTRSEVLNRDTLDPAGGSCPVLAGSWRSAYDGLVVTDPGATTQAPPPPRPPPDQFVDPPDCDPNYAGGCVPIASDVDCAGGSGNGPAYVEGPVTVIGVDVYDLDSDGDGLGCEG